MKKPDLNELTLTEKIAQLLMLTDTSLIYKMVDGENDFRPDDEINDIMQRYQFGSYWHTGNIKMDIVNMAEWSDGRKMTLAESKEYIENLQKNVRLPMLVAMDAENGLGYALDGGTVIPSALSIGAADDEELTTNLFAEVARELKSAGANWRWAPVIDMPNRLTSSICRIFSDDIERITRICTAAIRGSEKENVATTVKHFPGSDGLNIRDSHFSSTGMIASYGDWKERQGKVFQNMIDAGVMTIMISHGAFPAVDDEMINGRYIPSTISSRVIQGLLREEMGFEGVVITDAVCMAALKTFCSYEELLIRAINAGNDILLGVRPEDFDTVYQAVCDGRIPMCRIDESCERVLNLKEKIGLFTEACEENIDVEEVHRALKNASVKIAEKAVTLLYDHNNMLPISSNSVKNVAIVYASHFAGTVVELKVMKEEFEKRGALVNIYNGMPNGGIDTLVKESDLIIYAGYIGMHRPMGLPGFYDKQLVMFSHAFTKGKEKSIGVSMGYPYIHFDVMTGADTFINLYSSDAEAQIAFVKAIYGEIPFVGTSPVDIEPKIRSVYC